LGGLFSASVTIRAKTVFVVLPLIIAPLILSGVVSTLSARNGITSVATSFLQFKAEQLVSYAQSQWNLLASNGFDATPSYVDASKAAIESFAKSLVRSPTESIFALAADGSVAMQSSADGTPTAEEREVLKALAAGGASGWQNVRVAGVDRVGHVVSFAPFHWTFFVTEVASAFYAASDAIIRQSAYILGASLVAALLLLLVFSRYLTRPLKLVADAMAEIIATNDLSRRVEVLYKDETGRLGHTFNLMSEELDKAYGQIKGYALHAAVAKIKEEKIRHVFEKYVPKTVLQSFFANPEAALVGENRIVSILFSDVRDFTTISESMQPDQMVESLNNYFARMVNIIMDKGGVVDKYIGDAIMGTYGTTGRREDDALQSVLSALDMLDALVDFNKWQVGKRRTPFRTGIGIHYGVVTVGNIGSERRMDFTVIGDNVNLASRLEALTKHYKVPLIISDSVHRKVSGTVHCRKIDVVAVKGRIKGTGIYQAARKLTPAEEKAWQVYNGAMEAYLERQFVQAGRGFAEVQGLLPQDYCSKLLATRCAQLSRTPPPKEWTGVAEMTEK
jgi:adenylate cyclase